MKQHTDTKGFLAASQRQIEYHVKDLLVLIREILNEKKEDGTLEKLIEVLPASPNASSGFPDRIAIRSYPLLSDLFKKISDQKPCYPLKTFREVASTIQNPKKENIRMGGFLDIGGEEDSRLLQDIDQILGDVSHAQVHSLYQKLQGEPIFFAPSEKDSNKKQKHNYPLSVKDAHIATLDQNKQNAKQPRGIAIFVKEEINAPDFTKDITEKLCAKLEPLIADDFEDDEADELKEEIERRLTRFATSASFARLKNFVMSFGVKRVKIEVSKGLAELTLEQLRSTWKNVGSEDIKENVFVAGRYLKRALSFIEAVETTSENIIIPKDSEIMRNGYLYGDVDIIECLRRCMQNLWFYHKALPVWFIEKDLFADQKYFDLQDNDYCSSTMEGVRNFAVRPGGTDPRTGKSAVETRFSEAYKHLISHDGKPGKKEEALCRLVMLYYTLDLQGDGHRADLTPESVLNAIRRIISDPRFISRCKSAGGEANDKSSQELCKSIETRRKSYMKGIFAAWRNVSLTSLSNRRKAFSVKVDMDVNIIDLNAIVNEAKQPARSAIDLWQHVRVRTKAQDAIEARNTLFTVEVNAYPEFAGLCFDSAPPTQYSLSRNKKHKTLLVSMCEQAMLDQIRAEKAAMETGHGHGSKTLDAFKKLSPHSIDSYINFISSYSSIISENEGRKANSIRINTKLQIFVAEFVLFNLIGLSVFDAIRKHEGMESPENRLDVSLLRLGLKKGEDGNDGKDLDLYAMGHALEKTWSTRENVRQQGASLGDYLEALKPKNRFGRKGRIDSMERAPYLSAGLVDEDLTHKAEDCGLIFLDSYPAAYSIGEDDESPGVPGPSKFIVTAELYTCTKEQGFTACGCCLGLTDTFSPISEGSPLSKALKIMGSRGIKKVAILLKHHMQSHQNRSTLEEIERIFVKELGEIYSFANQENITIVPLMFAHHLIIPAPSQNSSDEKQLITVSGSHNCMKFYPEFVRGKSNGLKSIPVQMFSTLRLPSDTDRIKQAGLMSYNLIESTGGDIMQSQYTAGSAATEEKGWVYAMLLLAHANSFESSTFNRPAAVIDPWSTNKVTSRGAVRDRVTTHGAMFELNLLALHESMENVRQLQRKREYQKKVEQKAVEANGGDNEHQ